MPIALAAAAWLCACEQPAGPPAPERSTAAPRIVTTAATSSAATTNRSTSARSAAPLPAASDASAPAPSAAPTASSSADSRCPAEMVRIGRYCIDRWEAHLVTPGPGGEVHPHNLHPPDDQAFVARSAPGVFPQGHVSRHQAEAACRAADKRLCAWIEWRRACQGPKWRRWPYGDARREGVCNKNKDHLLMKLFGDDPRRWTRDDFNDPRLNLEPGFLAKTGAHEGCVSPDGLYDMVGNLHEWVIDPLSSDFLRKMKEESMPREKQPHALGNGIFMGGFYSTRSEHGQGCFFTTIAHAPRYYDYSTGFRCCKTAKQSAPASGR